jgi:acetyl-CoA carboxylase carboxyltransferase component
MYDVRLIAQASETPEMTWEPELEELRQRQALAREMGGPEKIARQRAAGRLTVRERIGTLLDTGSFHEIGSITGNGTYDEAGALQSLTPTNFLFGRGRIEGRRVVVAGDDFTVRGGCR